MTSSTRWSERARDKHTAKTTMATTKWRRPVKVVIGNKYSVVVYRTDRKGQTSGYSCGVWVGCKRRACILIRERVVVWFVVTFRKTSIVSMG